MNNTGWFRPAFVRATLIGGGILYIFSGITLLFTPTWFLESVGTFPPFNRHYMGDAGSFVLALGLGLLLAALWMPAVTVTYVMHMSLIWTILFLMVVIYLPAQIVLIISSLWAAKSRWDEEDKQ